MGIVAWDGSTMATDTNENTHGILVPAVKHYSGNLQDGSSFILGATAATHENNTLYQWVSKLYSDTLTTRTYTAHIEAILVHNTLGAFYMNGSMFCPLHRVFHAVGSGRDYAIAAMHLGKDAVKAAEIAGIYDPYSGGPIHFINMKLDGEHY